MTRTPQARSRSGHPVRHLCPGYVVLVDDTENEISRRVHGQVHLVIAPKNVTCLFVPDEGNGRVTLEATAGALFGGWQVRDEDGELVIDSRLADNGVQCWRLEKGSQVTLDFARLLDETVR